MNILVIGSRGFIGSAATSYYNAHEEYSVYSADILNASAERYFYIEAPGKSFDDIFSRHQFDICINASGAATVNASLTNPLLDYSLNTYNVFLMLDAIRKYNPECRFIQLSSAAVYGNPEKLPVREDERVHPLSPYGYHKWQSELICKEFYNIFGLKTVSVRIFSAYGYGLKKQLFWDLYQKSLWSDKVRLFGTGNESRDFIFIDDLVQALDCIGKRASFQGETYNIANGEEITIKTAVNLFYEQLGWKGDVIFSGEERTGDPRNWRADVSNLKKMGFRPVYGMREGLKKYVEWLHENESD